MPIVTMHPDLMKFLRCILILAVAFGAPFFARADVVDGVAAVVADKVVTFSEVVDATRPAEAALHAQYAGQMDVYQDKLNAAMQDSLGLLVDRALILHNYETGGYNQLPESTIDQMMQDWVRKDFGDRVTMIKTLQARGMTVEQYRKLKLDQEIEGGLRSANVSKDIIISPYKIETYYNAHPDDFKVDDQVKLRMIVLTKPSTDDTNTLALAREIVQKIKAGATFAEMAGVYSQSSQTHQGGDWGWVDRSVLRKELSDIAFTMNRGQVSDPVDTPDNVYIMLVEDKSAAHTKPLADVRDEIEKTLKIMDQAHLSTEWINGLKKKTYVRYFDH